jgi:putative hydrolase of HD superfamily
MSELPINMSDMEQQCLPFDCHSSKICSAVTIEHAVTIARVALTFGQVQRATLHPDGTPESDATHTVMLMMLVADVAAREGLNVGLAVQFAAVHDLPETYALDTCTARALSPEAAAEKVAREAVAVDRLRAELGPCWTTSMIDRYEAQQEPEARLVRYLDKVLPKLTHILNDGSALVAIDMTADEAERNHAVQRAKLHALYPEMCVTRTLFDDACSLALDTMRRREDQITRCLLLNTSHSDSQLPSHDDEVISE